MMRYFLGGGVGGWGGWGKGGDERLSLYYKSGAPKVDVSFPFKYKRFAKMEMWEKRFMKKKGLERISFKIM